MCCVMEKDFRVCCICFSCIVCFFFNDTATTEIYTVMNTLSLHDALPIWQSAYDHMLAGVHAVDERQIARSEEHTSELQSLITISYAAFCLKKKKIQTRKTGKTTTKRQKEKPSNQKTT